MMEKDALLKPLKPKERQFVHYIAYEGLDKLEAYSMAYEQEITEESRSKLQRKAYALFYKPHVQSYYQSIMDEIREKEAHKGAWTKEIATKKLLRLIEKAEEDIYGNPEKGIQPKQLTMSRLNAIILPIKELNTMNGFNQTNLNVEGCLVQIVGEENIPD